MSHNTYLDNNDVAVNLQFVVRCGLRRTGRLFGSGNAELLHFGGIVTYRISWSGFKFLGGLVFGYSIKLFKQ